jgi:hypothetical protein
MHSTLNRAQAVFGFFTTVALFVAGFAALSVLLFPTDAVKANVSLKDVKVYVACFAIAIRITLYICKHRRALINWNRIKGRPHYYSNKKEEYAQMRFDLDTGMSI